jgi:hypothetical protein
MFNLMKRSVFSSWLIGSNEILRLPRRARVLFAQRPPESFSGLSEVLKEVLPQNVEAEENLARALHAPPDLLRGLAKRDRDPLAVEATILTSVARLLSLSWPDFYRLVERDHQWYVRTLGMLLRQAPSAEEAAAGEARLRSAWERAALDDPHGLAEDIQEGQA